MQFRRLLEGILFCPTYLNKKRLCHQLDGKTVFITGASSGIGEQLAYALADSNCHLILTARREDKLNQVKKVIEKKAAKVSVVPADLRKPEELAKVISFLQKLPNGLDVFVSNAGLSIKRSIYESLDRSHDFSRTMAINYEAPVKLVLALLPILQNTKGQIIHISTVNALLAPVPYFAAYQASKTAFDVWLRSVAPEIEANGIATTTLYLPLVRTAMIEPTPAYRNMPAMSPNHVATVISKSMYTKQKSYKPWWLPFGQIASIFTRNFKDFTKTNKRRKEK